MHKKITRRAFCSMLLALPVAAQAQQPGKIFRIGVLDSRTASGSTVRLKALWQEVRRFGWIEGQNITIEYRFAERKNDRLPELAANLVRLKVDLIVVTGTEAALAAKRATTTIPSCSRALRTPWVRVWLPVWRGREAMSPGFRD